MGRYFRIVFLLILHYRGVAQTQDAVTFFKADGPESVALNQDFVVDFTLNFETYKKPTWPLFTDFKVVSGPHQQSSTTEYIDGTESIKSTSYKFILRARREGKFTIGRAAIVIGDSKLESNQLPINVIGPVEHPLGITDPMTLFTQPKSAGLTFPETIKGDSLVKSIDRHIIYKLKIDKDTIYKGAITWATYKLYFDVDPDSLHTTDLPDFNNFLCKEVELNERRRPLPERLNDKKYSEVDIFKYALYPIASGLLKISPIALHFVARVRKENPANPFNSFLNGGSFLFIPLDVRTEATSIFVKELPKRNKPMDFGGAVGSFILESQSPPSRSKFEVGQKISFSVTISGTGNIESISAPAIKFPASFKVLKPKIQTNDSINENVGLTGKRVFTYACIANEPGEFLIGDASFSYFDPTTEKYVSCKKSGFSVSVKSKPMH